MSFKHLYILQRTSTALNSSELAISHHPLYYQEYPLLGNSYLALNVLLFCYCIKPLTNATPSNTLLKSAFSPDFSRYVAEMHINSQKCALVALRTYERPGRQSETELHFIT